MPAGHREQPLLPVHYGCVLSLWTVGPSQARTRTALCFDASNWHPWPRLGIGGGPDGGIWASECTGNVEEIGEVTFAGAELQGVDL